MERKLKCWREGLRRHPMLWRAGRWLRLNQMGRYLYDRSLISKGHYRVEIMGQPLVFAISDPVEIRLVESAPHGEEEFIERLMSAIQQDDVVFDIGANMGVVSLLAASRSVPGVIVHAFEPEPHNAEHLRKSVQLNGRSETIHVHAIAFGKQCGNMQFYIERDFGGVRNSVIGGNELSASAIQVPMETGDGFFRRTGVLPTVAKIDVEGAEMDVLEGLNTLLTQGALRDLFMEIHPKNLASAGRHSDDVQIFLEERGYHQAWSKRRGGEIHVHYHNNAMQSPGPMVGEGTVPAE